MYDMTYLNYILDTILTKVNHIELPSGIAIVKAVFKNTSSKDVDVSNVSYDITCAYVTYNITCLMQRTTCSNYSLNSILIRINYIECPSGIAVSPSGIVSCLPKVQCPVAQNPHFSRQRHSVPTVARLQCCGPSTLRATSYSPQEGTIARAI